MTAAIPVRHAYCVKKMGIVFMSRKPNRESRDFLERANEQFQERATNAVPTALASYALIGSIIVFSLIGYGIDRWRAEGSHTFLLIGIIVGIVIGMVNLARIVWQR